MRTSLNVFYAWQNDLPSTTNRNLIEECLREALVVLNATAGNFEFILDKDTSDEMGTPAISDTILRKIQNSYIFIGDVSIVNDGQSGRPMPNPNVFFECGFAVSIMGWERVIFLANEAFGNPEQLPFDIRHRRITKYEYKIPDLTCVDDIATVSIEARRTTPNILTKEDNTWRFYIAKEGGTRLEDYSSDSKYKAFLQRLNKNEAQVLPSALRLELKNELKGIINTSKNIKKQQLQQIFVDAIGGIHKQLLVELPKRSVNQLVNILKQHNCRFIDDKHKNKYASLDILLSDLSKQPNNQEVIKCQVCASPTDLQKYLSQIPDRARYLKIEQFGGIAQTPGGWAHHYYITFLPDFFIHYQVQTAAVYHPASMSQSVDGTQVTTTQTAVSASGNSASLMPGNSKSSAHVDEREKPNPPKQ